MHSILRSLMVCWMVATTAHAPIPVCDGDNVGSAGLDSGIVNNRPAYLDVDFILLGCNHPDDPDDGPIEHDPEDRDSSSGVFPSYLRSLNRSITAIGKLKIRWPGRFGLCPTIIPAPVILASAWFRAEFFVSPDSAASLDASRVLRC